MSREDTRRVLPSERGPRLRHPDPAGCVPVRPEPPHHGVETRGRDDRRPGAGPARHHRAQGSERLESVGGRPELHLAAQQTRGDERNTPTSPSVSAISLFGARLRGAWPSRASQRRPLRTGRGIGSFASCPSWGIRDGMPREIRREEVRRLIDQGVQLVEVLPANEERQGGPLCGSCNS